MGCEHKKILACVVTAHQFFSNYNFDYFLEILTYQAELPEVKLAENGIIITPLCTTMLTLRKYNFVQLLAG